MMLIGIYVRWLQNKACLPQASRFAVPGRKLWLLDCLPWFRALALKRTSASDFSFYVPHWIIAVDGFSVGLCLSRQTSEHTKESTSAPLWTSDLNRPWALWPPALGLSACCAFGRAQSCSASVGCEARSRSPLRVTLQFCEPVSRLPGQSSTDP